MKKLTILIAFVISSTFAFSQIFQGQWLIGGNAGFESGKYGDVDELKYNSFQLNPNAGYFFIDNLSGGLRVNLETTKYKEADESTNSFIVAPFVRYYFLPAMQKVNIFADASYGFGSMKDGESESFNEYTIAAGPVVFLSPNTSLEFALQFNSEGGDVYGGEDRNNIFGFNVGFQVHLGNAKKK